MTRAPSLTLELERRGPFAPEAMTYETARSVAREYYVDRHGYRSVPRMLTAPESQHKLGMSERPAFGLSLAPADMSGWDACMWRTPACTAVCVLATAGKSVLRSVRDARILKTRFVAEHPQAFVTLVAHELSRAVRERGPIDFRPNVASDIRWERIAPAWFEIPDVRVYDYTKAPAGHRDAGAYDRLVYSVSEAARSVPEALEWLEAGGNAAVVFDTKKGRALPATWNGFEVVDADTSDSRIDDPKGTVVGLRAKGAARGSIGSEDGFVKPGVAT